MSRVFIKSCQWAPLIKRVQALAFACFSVSLAPSPISDFLLFVFSMAEGKPKAQAGVWSTVKPFVNGGASGMLATCVIQPIDMVKV